MNTSTATRNRFFKLRLIALFCSIALNFVFLNISAQEVLKQVRYDFDANEKLSAGKKAKYSLENKNGKFYIHQKSKENLNYGLGLFSMSDYSKYYDVDERFDLKFLNLEPDNALGASVSTYDGKGNAGYMSTTKFMLTADGKLRFYSGPYLEDNSAFLLLPATACASFKPGAVNRVGLVRNSHDWYVIVNGDTVKHHYEEEVVPILNLFSGRFEFAGKCDAELDNFLFSIYENDEKKKIETAKLKELPGAYLTFASCLKKEGKRVTLQLKRLGSGSKFSLSGLSDQPLEFYLEEHKEDVFSYYGQLTLVLGGEQLMMRKIAVTYDKAKNRHNLTFNVYGKMADGTTQDCDFDGDK